MRCSLVSAFFAEVIQQIHSFRASGVMSSHTAPARGSAANAFRKSAGIGCTTPPANLMSTVYPVLALDGRLVKLA